MKLDFGYRRAVRHGTSIYVNVPRPWAAAHNIKPGSKLRVVANNDGSITFYEDNDTSAQTA